MLIAFAQFFGCVLMLFAAHGSANAQSAPPPRQPKPDGLDVDLVSRTVLRTIHGLSIGGPQTGLTYSVFTSGGKFVKGTIYDSFTGGLTADLSSTSPNTACRRIFSFGSSSTCFALVNGSWQSGRTPATSLTDNGSGNWTVIDGSGTTYRISTLHTGGNFGFEATVNRVENPNGQIISIRWQSSQFYSRIASVTSNTGYQLNYLYASDSLPGTFNLQSEPWYHLLRVTGSRTADQFCPTTTSACTFVRDWPSVRFDWSGAGGNPGRNVAITDSGERVTTMHVDYFDRVDRIKPPESAADRIEYVLCSPPSFGGYVRVAGTDCDVYYANGPGIELNGWSITDGVKYAKKDGRIWDYKKTWPTSWGGGSLYVGESIDPDGRRVTLASQSNCCSSPTILTITTIDGMYNYDIGGLNQVRSFSVPGQSPVNYTYDGRGNLTTLEQLETQSNTVAKWTIDFSSTCTNRATCNKPNFEIDPRNGRTDYSYDANGNLWAVVAPAPTPGAARPLTLTTWEQRRTASRDASNVIIAEPDMVWVKVSEEVCQTLPGSDDQVCDPLEPRRMTQFEYGTSGTPDGLRIKGIAVTAGGTTLRTCRQYDAMENLIAETNARAQIPVCP